MHVDNNVLKNTLPPDENCRVCVHKKVCIFNHDNTPCKQFLNEKYVSENKKI